VSDYKIWQKCEKARIFTTSDIIKIPM